MLSRILLTLALLSPFTLPGSTFAADYDADLSHSSVLFKVLHGGVGFTYGMFTRMNGALTWGESVDGHQITFEVEADSVFTNNRRRDRHLKSDDFFDAQQFPKITFTSTRWVQSGEGSFQVTGNLTLRGVTKEITIPVRQTGSGTNRRGKQILGFASTFTITRSEFGVSYGLPTVAADQVELIVNLELVAR